MKHLTTFCIVLLLCLTTAVAQSYDTTQFYGKNNFLFQHIDKTPISTGLLRDYGIDFQKLDNYTGTALHDSNFTSLIDWRMLYGSLYSQQISSATGLFADVGVLHQHLNYLVSFPFFYKIPTTATINIQLS